MIGKHYSTRILLIGFVFSLGLLPSGCTKVQEIPGQDERIEISSITLSQASAEMLVGETVNLIATVLPPNATDKDKLIWSSSKQSVATINDKGTVQAVSPGVSTIMVSAGGKSASCTVTVSPKVVPVTGVSINPAKIEVVEGGTAYLTASVVPDDATNKVLRWSSDDEKVVLVSSDGVLTAVSQGKARVTAISEDGNKTATCEVTVVAKTVPVTGITLSSETIDLVSGGKEKLSVTVEPEDASDKSVTWSSSDESVATVDNEGYVSAVAAGEAIITATSSDGGKTAACKVTVSEKNIPVTGVSVKPESLSIVEGETAEIVASVTPEDATSKSVTWSSDNEDVATVSEEGIVTAVSAGKASVTATTVDSGKTASCTVTVTAKPVPVTGVSISSKTLTIEKGKSKDLAATVQPKDATNQKVTWASSNKSVATVSSNGVVTAVAAGTATITVTTQDGGFTASCDVTVPASASFSGLTLEAINSGTVTIDSDPMNLTIEMSKDGVNWTSKTGNQIYIDLSAGEKVYLRGDNSTYAKTVNGVGYCTTIVCTSPFYAYGNVMSLIDSRNFESLRSFRESKALDGLFQNSENLRSHPTKQLELPATELTPNCYSGMFYGCTGITRSPSLPATALSKGCYASMFNGCTSLINPPVLPATKLAESCYHSMFYGCTSLTAAPALPATTLAERCYGSMFSGCTSLINPPSLPAMELAAGCYYAMFLGCTGLTTSPMLPATTLAESCYRSMFNGCTSLRSMGSMAAKKTAVNSCYLMFRDCSSLTNVVSTLQATELADSCYTAMFYGCKSLRTAPSLPATKLAVSCYYNMFSGCSSLTGAPKLPATQLVTSCYSSMFRSCSSLKAAPTLPAENLAEKCYYAMFYDCSSLITVSRLPARTLAEACYYNMFNGCSSLVDAPQLLATTLADYCCCSMFRNCTSMKTAPSLYATTITKRCYGAMFQGCTSLVTPPELPAVSLPEGCYASMFKECSSLKTAPVIPATNWTLDCCYSMFAGCTSLSSMTVHYHIYNNSFTEDWVKGVSSSGVFYTYNTDDIVYGTNAIPTGWSVVSL